MESAVESHSIVPTTSSEDNILTTVEKGSDVRQIARVKVINMHQTMACNCIKTSLFKWTSLEAHILLRNSLLLNHNILLPPGGHMVSWIIYKKVKKNGACSICFFFFHTRWRPRSLCYNWDGGIVKGQLTLVQMVCINIAHTVYHEAKAFQIMWIFSNSKNLEVAKGVIKSFLWMVVTLLPWFFFLHNYVQRNSKNNQ